MVFFTGLPASGKSFLLRELISMAVAAGRRVQVIRWDAGLAAFETDSILARYPDVADGSHPVIRKAAGLWGRQAVTRWVVENPDPTEMLIGEVPIIGNRYSEFVQVLPDEAEPGLASGTTEFMYPVPTQEVRGKLEAIRRETYADPQHPDEAKDAPPTTMDLAWRLTRAKSIEFGLVAEAEIEDRFTYDDTIYRRFFDHLLQHRNARAIEVDRLYSGGRSAHDLEGRVSELIATAGQVATAIAAVEAVMNAEEAAREIENWHRV